MDRFEPNLRIPGPTGLPPSVRTAGARQMINHRGPEFAAMLERILVGIKPFFGTTNDVAMITTAGSGGLEAAIVNTLSPGPVSGPRMERNFALESARVGISYAEAEADFVSRAALRRMVTEAEVATAVIMMLSMPGLCGADIDLSAGMVAR